MATPILSLPPAATADIPTLQPITIQVRTLGISQAEILEVMDLRNEVAKLQADLEERELSIKARLDMGCAVEAGPRTARLKEIPRRNVAWKPVVVRLAERLGLDGEAYCANVLTHTAPTISFSLVVG